jgi:hypothetical protein
VDYFSKAIAMHYFSSDINILKCVTGILVSNINRAISYNSFKKPFKKLCLGLIWKRFNKDIVC